MKVTNITKQKFDEIINFKGDNLISIYMNVETTKPEDDKNRIKLKNFISLIEDQLKERGLSQDQIEDKLKELKDIHENGYLTNYSNPGIAIFISDEFSYAITLMNHNFEDKVYIGKNFYIVNLIPELKLQQDYMILKISLNESRLYHCSPYEIKDLSKEDYPKNIKEALGDERYEKSLQFRTADPGKKATVFHGQGAGKDDKNNEFERYIQNLTNSIDKIMHKYNDPKLILACDDEHYQVYLDASNYKNISSYFIHGNHDETKDHELMDKGMDIIKKDLENKKNKQIDEYEHISPEKKESELEKVLQESFQGRLDTLLMNRDKYIWGKADFDTLNIDIHKNYENGDEDLINLAAKLTLENNGEVYVNDDSTKLDEDIKAVMRY